MVIADTLLKVRAAEGKPIRVGIVGAGATGRLIVRQLLTPILGIQLVAIANRTLSRAVRALKDVGRADGREVHSEGQLADAFTQGIPAVTDDALLLCRASCIDVIVEVTGTVEFGAVISMEAIRNHKHVVLVNAELDSTLGPILKAYADKAGVVITNTDGDEPGVAMNLVRYLRSIGLRPVAAGNLKGMIDRYRNPETQRAFAEKFNQDAAKVTSFADGTKLSMEATILANATGFRVGQRGMYGPRCAHVKEIGSLLPAELLTNGGLVDYALGAEPHTGAFVVVHEDEPIKRRELGYYKLGDGPFFVFYTPYHVPHVQIASTIARAVLFNDPTVAPLAGPICKVVACAKKDLREGEILDGVGGFMTYGVIDNANSPDVKKMLPMGLAEGCRLKRSFTRDESVGMEDVIVPSGRQCDRLWEEQTRKWQL